MDAGVVAEALEVVAIADVALAPDVFTEAERAYASSKSDPERRLAARLAAKRAAIRILGSDLSLSEIEVLRARGGPPALRLGANAEARRVALGGGRFLVSLTHGRSHAAASVLLVQKP